MWQTDERIQGGTPEQKKLTAAYQTANIFSSLVPLICQQELMAVLALHQGQERQWLDEVELVYGGAQAGLALLRHVPERISALPSGKR